MNGPRPFREPDPVAKRCQSLLTALWSREGRSAKIPAATVGSTTARDQVGGVRREQRAHHAATDTALLLASWRCAVSWHGFFHTSIPCGAILSED